MRFKYTNETVDTALSKQGKITRVEHVFDSQLPILWKCNTCSHTWRTSPTKIIASKTGCPTCSYAARAHRRTATTSDIDLRISKADIDVERLTIPTNMTSKIKWKCNRCLYTWYNSVHNIIRTKIGCPVCKIDAQTRRNAQGRFSNDQIDDLVQNRLIDRVGSYVNMLTKLMWRCQGCEHTWLARPNDVINNNSGCPCCCPRTYSRSAIQWLDQIALTEGIQIQHAENGGEFRIPLTRFKADGFCSETNTVYEYYGDVYHGNPVLYEAHELCHPFTTKSAGELFKATIVRETRIRELGYNVITKWQTALD